MSTTEQPEHSKQHDTRGQHALSCRPIDLRSTGGLAIKFWRPTGNVQVSFREKGTLIRVSPALFNTRDEIRRFLDHAKRFA